MEDHEIIIALYDYPHGFNMIVDGIECEEREELYKRYGDSANEIGWVAKENEDEMALDLIHKIAEERGWGDCSVRLILVIDSRFYQFYYISALYGV